MAASLSRPDPSSPASVAEAGFSTARRGYQQDEVRAFLTSVAAELGRLQERERQLEAELRDLRDRPPESVELDDDTVAELLGEETLRVLHTARESASEIKIRAEENAARILREANDEANRLRQEAEVEAARKRQDSSSDAEAEVALAKQQGREMVNEARAYRERVLADLERRTTLARHQIEELIHGRDRLLQVFERARLVAVDVTSDLHAIDGPDELVNLTPTTGPVPLMVPRQRASAPTSDATDETDETDADGETDANDDGAVGETDETGDEGAADVDGFDETDDDHDDDGDAETAAPTGGSDANVVSLFRDRSPADEEPVDAAATTDRTDVGGIFERLRSEVPADAAAESTTVGIDTDTDTDTDSDTDSDTDTDTTDTTDTADDITDTADDITDTDTDVQDEVEPTPFSRRDEALVPLIVAAARKLKRVLADEQNGVLDTLRQKDPVTAVDALLPAHDDHLAHYVAALEDEMLAAAAAGATELGLNDTKTLRRKLGKSGALEAAHALIADDLVGPLRERLARAIADGSGDNDDITKRVRAVYREWKTQHIDDQLDDVFRFAHGGGIATTIEPGAPMVWTIDPTEPACADCEDNSLAGPVAAGDAYPTGHTSAPAHPGCRCLTVPVGQ